MNPENRELTQERGSLWATCPILSWGIFGTKTRAERRYMRRTLLGAATAAAWVLIALARDFHPKAILLPLTALVLGAVVTNVAWEISRYIRQLDELARRLQLEALAWTYLTGFVAAAWLGVLAPLSSTLMHWPYKRSFLLLSPFLYHIVLEPVRSAWLYFLSRRY